MSESLVRSLSGSPEDIISASLAAYTELTEKSLVNNDSLATGIKSGGPPLDIDHVFEQHAQAFGDGDDVKTHLRAILDKLQALSTTPAMSEVAPGLPAVGLFQVYGLCHQPESLKRSVL